MLTLRQEDHQQGQKLLKKRKNRVTIAGNKDTTTEGGGRPNPSLGSEENIGRICYRNQERKYDPRGYVEFYIL